MFQVRVVLSAVLKVFIFLLWRMGKMLLGPMGFFCRSTSSGHWGKTDAPPYCQSGNCLLYPIHVQCNVQANCSTELIRGMWQLLVATVKNKKKGDRRDSFLHLSWE